MKVVALAGGVGGAKMVYGLDRILPPGNLSVIVNTGDDFIHYGLYICPDIDTVIYQLAEINNSETGWGRNKESYQALSEAIKLGGPGWFQIGDKDLGTHLERTRRMKAGQRISEITEDFCQRRNITSHIYPMTDDRVSTILRTKEKGELSFQEYFVHQRCKPRVFSIRFEGYENASPVEESIHAIQEAELIVICPSNPWVSIDPILSIKKIKESLITKKVIAVSPIIQGKTLRGPAAKIFKEMGIEPSAVAVLRHYKKLISGFIYDKQDIHLENQIKQEGIISRAINTIMHTPESKMKLAQEIVDFSNYLS